LEIVDVIAESSARLIVNRANYQTKRHEIVGFMDALEETIRANTRKGAS
jgi:ATP phosphoribosyltransferase